jgi:Pleckstrin homology domain
LAQLYPLSFYCSRLDLTAPTRNMGPRRLIREGVVTKAKSGRKLRIFLCNDILVLTDENAKALYKMVRSAAIYVNVLNTQAIGSLQPIPLSELAMKESAGTRGAPDFLNISTVYLTVLVFFQTTQLFTL